MVVTSVRTSEGITREFLITIGLHQGSTLSLSFRSSDG